MTFKLPVAAALAFVLAGCAGAPPAASTGQGAPASAVAAASGGERSCFWSRNVNGFRALDDDTVNLRVGVKDVYQLELLGRCPDVDWAQGIALESRGGSFICSGLDATIISPSSIGPQRCAVRTLRKLSDQEVAALEPKQRP